MVNTSKHTKAIQYICDFSPNQKAVATLLHKNKELTRKELKNLSELSDATITRCVITLLQEGIIVETNKRRDNGKILRWVGGIPAIEEELMNATNIHVEASLLAENYDSLITSAFSVFSLLFENNYWEIIMNLKEGLTDVEISQRTGNSINLDSVRRVLVTCDTHNLINLNMIREPASGNIVRLFEPLYRIEYVNKDFFEYMVILRGLASAMQYKMENKKLPGYSHPYETLLTINVELFTVFKEHLMSKTNIDEQKLLSKVLLNYDYKEDLERLYKGENWRSNLKTSKNVNIDSTSNHILLSDSFVGAAKENMIKQLK